MHQLGLKQGRQGGLSRELNTSYHEQETCIYPQEDPFGNEGMLSPNKKLQILAAQLGECCLTTDLAALISQRRNIQLEISAKRFNSKK